MLAHLLGCLPEEGCGILGGRAYRAELVLPVTNTLHSPVRFRMLPEELWNAFRQIEDRGYELVAIFHSHPAGPANPSETDVSEFAYPGVVSIIWSPQAGIWQPRAFHLDDGKIVEVNLTVA